MSIQIYLAGPLFNIHERWFLEKIADALHQSGYNTFLPHRDAGLIDLANPNSRKEIFHADVKALEEADICVALLTGPDHDSGTCAELGYMYAKGKTCFGITDDMRWLNNLIWGLCGEGDRIASTVDQLIEMVNSYAQK